MRVPRISAGELFRTSGARAVVFDMDGVLADTEEFHVTAWQRLLEVHTATSPSRDVIRSTFGQTNDAIIPLLWRAAGREAPGAELSRLSREKEAYYREAARNRVRPVTGLERFLAWLERRRIPRGIGTSGPIENVRFLLDEFGWCRKFEVLVDRSRFVAGKPAPDCFLSAVSALRHGGRRLAASQVLVFEDSVHGLRAARRGGLLPAAVATTLPESLLWEEARWVFRDFECIAC